MTLPIEGKAFIGVWTGIIIMLSLAGLGVLRGIKQKKGSVKT